MIDDELGGGEYVRQRSSTMIDKNMAQIKEDSEEGRSYNISR